MALGGVLAALAVVIMAMGTLIPIATYVCPMLCAMLLQVYCMVAGNRLGWAWFWAVAILSLLLASDKEAAVVFCGIGYYPILKPRMDKMKGSLLWKGLLFNGAIAAIYGMFIRLMGLDAVLEEFRVMGSVMTLITLVMGNMIFFLLDRVLSKIILKGGG